MCLVSLISTEDQQTDPFLEEKIKIFERLCHANSDLNRAFSIPVWILLVVNFLIVVSNGFACISGMMHSNFALRQAMPIILCASATYWTRILIILSSCDLPIIEVTIYCHMKPMALFDWII